MDSPHLHPPTRSPSLTHSYGLSVTPTLTHSLSPTHVHSHTPTHPPTPSRTHAHTHTHRIAHIHTCAYIDMHTHMHAGAHACTHTGLLGLWPKRRCIASALSDEYLYSDKGTLCGLGGASIARGMALDACTTLHVCVLHAFMRAPAPMSMCARPTCMRAHVHACVRSPVATTPELFSARSRVCAILF